MTDASSPFDDPEFIEMLKRSGVTHRPGMADELMEEIGPLLAADGFDVTNQNQDVDFDDLNSAMSRAIERRNMELVTPVGNARSRTIDLLRKFVTAYREGKPHRLDVLLGQLRPDPSKHHPSYSHLMGVALETLDSWHADKSLRPALGRVSSDEMPAEVKPVAADLDALARKGRAFLSIDSLLLKHNGAIITEAGAYQVAASVTAVAKHRQQPVSVVLDELLPGEETSGGFGTGAAFGAAAAQQVNSQDQLGDFEAWLVDNEDTTNSSPEDIKIFKTIVDTASQWGLEPFDPNDFTGVIDMALQFEDFTVTAWSLSVLHDYVHFRMEGEDGQSWYEAHEAIAEVDADIGNAPSELQDLMARLSDIPAEDRYAAVMATPLISGVAKLTDWIGKSQSVTGTGMPKRAHIAEVASMINIDAQGVAKLPPFEAPDAAVANLDLSKPAQTKPTIKVQSAKDIPELRAWWSALEITGGIELTSTTVRPGAMADVLAGAQLDDLEQLEMLMVSYIRQYLLQETEMYFGSISVAHTLSRLISMADDDDGPMDAMAEAPSPDIGLGSVLSIRHLRSFESMGLLEIRDAQPVIPEPLRSVVMLGAMLTASELEPHE